MEKNLYIKIPDVTCAVTDDIMIDDARIEDTIQTRMLVNGNSSKCTYMLSMQEEYSFVVKQLFDDENQFKFILERGEKRTAEAKTTKKRNSNGF
jgi:hypothetical protein